MATYTYSCKECDIITVVTRNMSDNEVFPECSKCNAPMVRSYTWGGTTFNGPGFYTSDKRSENTNYKIKE